MATRRDAVVSIDRYFTEEQYPTAEMWARNPIDYETRIDLIEAILAVIQEILPAAIKQGRRRSRHRRRRD